MSAGVNAILVKVAGAGLEPFKHLGKSLGELHPTLTRLNQRFGLDVCGEGGEYESMVLDCSAFVSRLVVDSAEVVVDEEDINVGNLRITCHVEAKENKNCVESVADGTTSAGRSAVTSLPSLITTGKGLGQTELVHAQHSVIHTSNSNTGDVNLLVQAQLRDILSRLSLALKREEATLADAVFVHLYISSVGLFGAANEEYCKWFGKNPPSRSCVIVPLPHGHLVAMDVTFLAGSHKAVTSGHLNIRNVLHVQSVSEWAPLCIGPYCQANTIHDAVRSHWIQVTLLASDDVQITSQRDLLNAQLTLACRHVSRALEVQSSSLRNTLNCTVFVNTTAVRCGDAGEQSLLFDDIQRLVLRLLQTNCESGATMQQSASGDGESDDGQSDEEEEEEEESPYAKLLPVMVIGVSGLPRDALVEVEVSALKHSDLPNLALLHRNESSPLRGPGASALTGVAKGERRSVDNEVLSASLCAATDARHVDSGDASFLTAFSHMQISRVLCSGFCHVSTSHTQTSCVAKVSEAVHALVVKVRDALLAAEICPGEHLLGFRVYFRPEEMDE
eukprot:gene25830-32326_t